MTDHPILCRGENNRPFEHEARLVTRFFTFIGTTVPSRVAAAIRARNLFDDLNGRNDEELAALGLARTDIAPYAAKKAGLLDL